MSNLATTDVAIAGDGRNLSLSFVVAGDPQAQYRTKSNWKARKVAKFYDPSCIAKADWKQDLRKALADCGVTKFPFFGKEHTDIDQAEGLYIDIEFYILRCKKDYKKVKGVDVLKDEYQKYPGKKDTDNMIKFVMDAAHTVLYDDDKCVCKISAVKKFVSEDEKKRGPYTKIFITTM